MTTIQGVRILAGAWWKALRNRLRSAFAESGLKTWTLAVFLLAYLTAGFLMFHYGLRKLNQIPVVSDVLVERVIYMMFFSFLLMLIFSNGVINFMGLYRNRETQWILSLPIPASAVLIWKTLESLILSSWGLILLSAPILLAFGITEGADFMFYLKTMGLLAPFLILPACLGSWILVLVMRFYKSWWNWVAAAVFLGLAGWLVKSLMFRSQYANVDPNAEELLAPQSIGGLGGALSYTEGAMHALLPSSWLADSVLSWSHGYDGAGWFHVLLMISYALMGLLVTNFIGVTIFYSSWNAAVFRGGGEYKAESKRLKKSLARQAARAQAATEPPAVPRLLFWTRALPRQIRALLVKDLLTMWRDGAQRIQFLIVFGLLFFYSLNIQNLGYNLNHARWLTSVSYLNLVICTLALSMLTTRFVFPQFSIEGQRIWILGMSPISLTKVMWQKLATSIILTSLCTVPLILISGTVMRLPWQQVTFHMGAMAAMNVGLNVIAVCFGAIFPNMRDNNPARIVSGFGGTLCLLASFVYIMTHILVLLLPAVIRLRIPPFRSWFSESVAVWISVGFLVLFNVTLFVILTTFAKKQIKNWKF